MRTLTTCNNKSFLSEAVRAKEGFYNESTWQKTIGP